MNSEANLTDPPSPSKRVARTALQTLVAVLVAFPAAVALLPLDPDEVVWPIGIAGFLVVLISAVQNGWDDQRGNG